MAATASLHNRSDGGNSPGPGVAASSTADVDGLEGLVLCVITDQDHGFERVVDLARGFPSVQMVDSAAALLPHQDLAGTGSDRLYVARSGRTHVEDQVTEQRRKQGRSVVEVSGGAVVLRERGGWAEGSAREWTRDEVTGWSARSRSRLVLGLAQLDYSPMLALGTPAMVTFTLPGDWLTVAPTGKAFKALVKQMFQRLERAYGKPAAALLWKLEFQRRGAPHLHTFMVPPTSLVPCNCRLCPTQTPVRFSEWLSHNWADVVNHPNPTEYAKHVSAGTGIDYREGLKARDPKRLAVYFAKHGGAAGGKEYQHVVPEPWQVEGAGPGRFWGYRGLVKVTAATPVPDADFVRIKRTLRRLSQRQAFYGDVGSRWPTKVERRTRTVRVPRGASKVTGEVLYRTVTRPRSYLNNAAGGGFLLVNDGPALVSALARLERNTP